MAEELEFEYDTVRCLEEFYKSFKSKSYPTGLFSGKGKEVLAEALNIALNEYAEIPSLDFNGYLLLAAMQKEDFVYRDKIFNVVICQSNREITIKGKGKYSDVIDITLSIDNDIIKLATKSHYNRSTKDNQPQEVFYISEKTFHERQSQIVDATSYYIPEKHKQDSDFDKLWFSVLESSLKHATLGNFTPNNMNDLKQGKNVSHSEQSITSNIIYDENTKTLTIYQTNNDSFIFRNYTLKTDENGREYVLFSKTEHKNLVQTPDFHQESDKELD